MNFQKNPYWKLVKAEVVYDKAMFIVLYSVVLLTAGLNVIIGGLEDNLARIMFLTLVVMGIVSSNDDIKYKRNRFIATLPIPVRKIVLAQFPILGGYWLGLLVIFTVSCFFSRGGELDHRFVYYLMILSGTFFGLIGWMGVFIEVPYSIVKRMNRILIRSLALFLATLSAAAYLMIVEFFADSGNPRWLWMTLTLPRSLLILAWGAFSNFVYVRFFIRRRSYTD